MKFEPDCVRLILLELETLSLDEITDIDSLSSVINDFNSDKITYNCLKLAEAGYITIDSHKNVLCETEINSIDDITYAGHQFLANIREEKVWTGVKSVASKIGATSLSAFTQIASNVITELIKAQFGIGMPPGIIS